MGLIPYVNGFMRRKYLHFDGVVNTSPASGNSIPNGGKSCRYFVIIGLLTFYLIYNATFPQAHNPAGRDRWFKSSPPQPIFVQTVLDIDEALFRQLEQQARQKGKPLRVFLEEALREVVRNTKRLDFETSYRMALTSASARMPSVVNAIHYEPTN